LTFTAVSQQIKGASKRPVASLGAHKYTVGFGGNKQVYNS